MNDRVMIQRYSWSSVAGVNSVCWLRDGKFNYTSRTGIVPVTRNATFLKCDAPLLPEFNIVNIIFDPK